jgi:hypothetical protein
MIALLRKLSKRRDVIETHLTLIMLAVVFTIFLFRFIPTGRLIGFDIADASIQFMFVFLFVYFLVLLIAYSQRPKRKK